MACSWWSCRITRNPVFVCSASSSFCFVAFSYFKVFLIWLLLAVFVLFDATTRYKYKLFTKRVESILSCLEDNSVTGCLNPWCTRCPQYEPSTLKATQSHSWFFLHGCGNFFFRLFNLHGIEAQSGTFWRDMKSIWVEDSGPKHPQFRVWKTKRNEKAIEVDGFAWPEQWLLYINSIQYPYYIGCSDVRWTVQL